MKIRYNIALAALASTTIIAPSASAETEVFFAEDIGLSKENACERQRYSNSQVAGDAFKARLGGVDEVSFEELAAAKKAPAEIALDFGDGQKATLHGMTEVVELADPSATYNGCFPVQGTKAMLLICETSPKAEAKITFSEPQGAFGFYVTDIEQNTFSIELLRDSGAPESVTLPVTLPQGSGGACFVGVINKASPFKGVRFKNAGTAAEGWGFDDMMIAKPQQIADPTPLLMSWGKKSTVTIQGDVGTRVMLDYSDDNTNWHDLEAVTLTESPFIYVDETWDASKGDRQYGMTRMGVDGGGSEEG